MVLYAVFGFVQIFLQFWMISPYKQTIICRQLFADFMVGSRPMKRKNKKSRLNENSGFVHADSA